MSSNTIQGKKGLLSTTQKDVLAGTTGGIAQVLVGQPLDILKVRLQTSPQGTYNGMLDCAKRIVTKEGPLAFYKGTLTPLLGVGACVSIQFGVMERLKREFKQLNVNQSKPDPSSLTNSQLYVAGGLAGLANSWVAGPVENIRIRLQTQQNNQFKGPLDCVSKILKSNGLPGLFKGQVPTLLREGHGMGMYFLTYEFLVQRKLAKDGITRSELPSSFAMFAGACAGYGLWLTAYPFDIVKSRLQTDSLIPEQRRYKGTLDCARQILQESGPKGFFRGLLPTLVRSPFANAATFVAFEWAARNLDKL